MGRYILVYTGGSEPGSEEEYAAVMDAWNKWYGALGEAVDDGGNPFGPGKRISSDGGMSDVPQGSEGTGFTVLKAESLDAAVELAKGCPILDGNGTVTVYEGIEM